MGQRVLIDQPIWPRATHNEEIISHRVAESEQLHRFTLVLQALCEAGVVHARQMSSCIGDPRDQIVHWRLFGHVRSRFAQADFQMYR